MAQNGQQYSVLIQAKFGPRLENFSWVRGFLIDSPCPAWFPFSPTRFPLPAKCLSWTLKVSKPSFFQFLESRWNNFFTTFSTIHFSFSPFPFTSTAFKQTKFFNFPMVQSLKDCPFLVSSRKCQIAHFKKEKSIEPFKWPILAFSTYQYTWDTYVT